MIGARIGGVVGPAIGARIGIGMDQLGGSATMAGVTRDATSGIYCPATAAEWAQTLAVANIGSGGPLALWRCGEASGNLADSIGTFTGVAGGTGQLYQQPQTGWTRQGVGFADAANGDWLATSGIADAATTSFLCIAYVNVSAIPAAVRSVLRIATTTSEEARVVTVTAAPRITAGANTATGSNDTHGQVRPWALKHNATASAQLVYTDLEKVTGTFAALSGAGLRIGSGSANAAATNYLYVAWFSGSAAEMTDAQLKKLLQTLGWNPLWS